MLVVESFSGTNEDFSELWRFFYYKTSVGVKILNGPASSEFLMAFNGLN